jgi:hypothetical protein
LYRLLEPMFLVPPAPLFHPPAAILMSEGPIVLLALGLLSDLCTSILLGALCRTEMARACDKSEPTYPRDSIPHLVSASYFLNPLTVVSGAALSPLPVDNVSAPLVASCSTWMGNLSSFALLRYVAPRPPQPGPQDGSPCGPFLRPYTGGLPPPALYLHG